MPEDLLRRVPFAEIASRNAAAELLGEKSVAAVAGARHSASLACGWRLSGYIAARSGNARVTAAVRLEACSLS